MAVTFGLLSIYFYKASVKIGEISYQITKTKIFDSRISTPDIVVTRGEGGPQIKSDVFATEVVLWNSGDLRADSEGNRPDKPLTLELDGNGEIVGSVVQGWNRRDLSSYSLKASEDKRRLVVEWNKFRPGFGIRLTVLHTGDATTTVRVSADIFEFSIRDRSLEEKEEPKELLRIFGRPITTKIFPFLAMALMLPIFILLEYKRFRMTSGTWTEAIKRRWPSLLTPLLMFLFVIYYFYSEFLSRAYPPI